MRLSWLAVILVAFFGAGCAAPNPIQEYSIARAAMQAARSEGAPRLAAAFWLKAEDHYQKGERYYRQNDFARAREQFDLAREFAEKAENATRLRKAQQGEF